MGVTVNEIARICGVSRTTVLRALNNQSRVSDKTRRQVLEVAKELGYRPNLLARSLNTGRTMTLGIVAINMDSLIFVQTLSAINTEAQRKGYSLNIALHGQSSEAEMQRIRDFTDRRMEGILLSPISKGPEFERFVLSLGIPVVCIGNHVSEKISTVMIDEELATREAVRLIASRGYRRIVFVCPPLAYESRQNIYSHIRRKRGLEAEIALHPGLSLPDHRVRRLCSAAFARAWDPGRRAHGDSLLGGYLRPQHHALFQGPQDQNPARRGHHGL